MQSKLLSRLCGAFPPAGPLLAGVSGGGDSVALLRLLYTLAPKRGWIITVGHVDHRLRPDSASDSAFVAGLADGLGLDCRIMKPEIVRQGRSPEEAARLARHGALQDLAAELGAGAIALGHNAEDQAETLLLRALSGTGPTGMAGIRPNQGLLWRPLLAIGRGELREYLNALGQSWRKDPSNQDLGFARNRVRSELLPLAQRLVNPRAVESLGRLAAFAAQDEDYWQRQCQRVLSDMATRQGESLLLAEACRELHPALLGRVLRQAARELTGQGQNLLSLHLEQLLELWQGPAGRMLELPLGLSAWREPGGLRLDASQGAPDYHHVMQGPGELDLGGAIGRLVVDIQGKPDRLIARGSDAWLPYGQVDWPLTVRPPQRGDRFQALGAPGHKRLSRFFIDQKVSKWWRSRSVVVEDQKGILWVGPLAVSERARRSHTASRWLRLRLIDSSHHPEYTSTLKNE